MRGRRSRRARPRARTLSQGHTQRMQCVPSIATGQRGRQCIAKMGGANSSRAMGDIVQSDIAAQGAARGARTGGRQSIAGIRKCNIGRSTFGPHACRFVSQPWRNLLPRRVCHHAPASCLRVSFPGTPAHPGGSSPAQGIPRQRKAHQDECRGHFGPADENARRSLHLVPFVGLERRAEPAFA